MSQHDDLQPDLQPVIDQLARTAPRRPRSSSMRSSSGSERSVATPARRRTRREHTHEVTPGHLDMLVLGMLLSTTGAGLAVTGLAQTTRASRSTATRRRQHAHGRRRRPRRAGHRQRQRRRAREQRRRQPSPSSSRAARPAGRGGRQQQHAPVHRLRRDPGPARRHRAAERGPRAPASHRRRALSAALHEASGEAGSGPPLVVNSPGSPAARRPHGAARRSWSRMPRASSGSAARAG